MSIVQNTAVEQEVAPDAQVADNAHRGSWPLHFEFPTENLPAQVVEALEKKVNLIHPKHRYLHGMLLQTLCKEAVKITSHPDYAQKIDMARSIVTKWPYLKEPICRGYDGWLASIVDGLKSMRRACGLVDQTRSAAVKRRHVAATNHNVESASHVQMTGQSHEQPIASLESYSVSSASAALPCCSQATLDTPATVVGCESAVAGMTAESISRHDQATEHSPEQQVASSESCSVSSASAALPCCSQATSDTPATVVGRESAVAGMTVKPPPHKRRRAIEELNLSNESIEDMKTEWRKSDSERDHSKLLRLLCSTLDDRRNWLYSTSVKTADFMKAYPALFFRDGIIQEFEVVTGTSNSMQIAVENAKLKAPKLVEIAREKCLQKPNQKIHHINNILTQMELCMEHHQSPETAESIRATAGLMLLPILLGENMTYFFVDCCGVCCKCIAISGILAYVGSVQCTPV